MLGAFVQQGVLAAQVRRDVYCRVIEQDADFVERQPNGPVHQDELQPLDVGGGVAAVVGGGADAGHDQTDVVVVVKRAHRDAGQFGNGSDGLGIHAAAINPDGA